MTSPGPWAWEDGRSLVAAGNRGLAVYFEPGGAPTAEDAANLALIASAPTLKAERDELVAMLRALVSAHEYADKFGVCPVCQERTCDRVAECPLGAAMALLARIGGGG